MSRCSSRWRNIGDHDSDDHGRQRIRPSASRFRRPASTTSRTPPRTHPLCASGAAEDSLGVRHAGLLPERRNMVEAVAGLRWREDRGAPRHSPENFIAGKSTGSRSPLHPTSLRRERTPRPNGAHLPGLGPGLPRYDRLPRRPARPRWAGRGRIRRRHPVDTWPASRHH